MEKRPQGLSSPSLLGLVTAETFLSQRGRLRYRQCEYRHRRRQWRRILGKETGAAAKQAAILEGATRQPDHDNQLLLNFAGARGQFDL